MIFQKVALAIATSNHLKFILGSSSPRRRALLAQIGVIPVAIRSADIDETPHKNEIPRLYARRLAHEKSLAFALSNDEIILCADTVVGVGRRILGKPENPEQAIEYLRLLSGRRHRVTTAITLRSLEKTYHRDVVTIVRFKRLSTQEITDYIRSNEWQGKAGGYAIQGIGAAFIPAINGSYSNVVGLPLTETAALLTTANIPVSFDGANK